MAPADLGADAHRLAGVVLGADLGDAVWSAAMAPGAPDLAALVAEALADLGIGAAPDLAAACCARIRADAARIAGAAPGADAGARARGVRDRLF